MILQQNAPAARAPRGGNDSSHYYGHEPARGWFPLYTPDKNFTLREARKIKDAGGVAVPSVTAYLGELRKKQVEDWKMERVAEACFHMMKEGYGKTLNEWVDMATGKADNASRPAALLGNGIHAAIENAVAGKDWDAALDIYVQPVLAERQKIGLLSIAQEKCVGSLEHGYGGRVDDICESMIIADYKSRGEAKAYPTDWVQCASYGYAEFGNDFFLRGAGVVFPISTKVPGEVVGIIKTGPELVQAFEAFIGLTGTWRYFHNYEPRSVEKTATN